MRQPAPQFHVAFQNDKLLTQERVFRDEFGLGPDQIRCGCFEQDLGGRFGPAFKASVNYFHDVAQPLPQEA